ncbi:hypothetical protein [Methanococcus maripaludis]|uniref:Uncharacterized protein n=1 Tax=Methanococcus maripaludis TaxID=39152 RepID=A0A7J9PP98_METMI|nr:hypothetical protein [Methanococcus maripaludis]MBA2864447.1 hypothetical protein [Methanococcus maripaludis]
MKISDLKKIIEELPEDLEIFIQHFDNPDLPESLDDYELLFKRELKRDDQ